MNYPKTSQMEKELFTHLRDSASGNARAMTATLIVVSTAEKALELDEVVDTLMGRRPVRVLHLRSGAAGPTRHWSSARCALDRQNKGVCFEDVYIESPDASALEGRVWGPLVIRELPVLLLWTLGPEYLLNCGFDCVERVDLTILDGTGDLENIKEGIQRYRDAVLEASSASSGIADLAWERSVSLRYAIARLFDGPFASDLSKLRDVTISGTDSWTAGLIGGWLLDRLRHRNKGLHISYTGYPSVKKSHGEMGNSRLPTVRFMLEASEDAQDQRAFKHAAVCFTGLRQGSLEFPDGSRREVSFPETSHGSILSRLVDNPVADPLYIAALENLVIPV